MTHTLVLVRHGQSVWNQKNLFTGWVDVDLTDQGVAEARAGAEALAAEGLSFDVAHTSMQRRAIRTLHLVLDRLDLLWLTVHKSWRLNERHYGALQGLDKKATVERHGAEQVHAWRRGYATPPPPVEAGSEFDVSSDPRYADLPPDLMPMGECLADVVDRLLPYWHDAIVPDLRAGKRVIVSAHGNSLRALIKHLDGISDDDIAGLNLPTGVPMLYELDDDLRPTAERRFLGDADAIAAAAEAVAKQTG
ncbi:MAG: 2,3-diphosphoglycerate-dependent phosphoglycerate mutase [Actinomycetota bacterium]